MRLMAFPFSAFTVKLSSNHISFHSCRSRRKHGGAGNMSNVPIVGPAGSLNPVLNLQQHFGAIQGSWYMGINLQSLVIGGVIVQVYDYATLYKEDALYLRMAVGLLMVLNLLQCSSNWVTGWDHFITNFGDYPGLLGSTMSTRINLFVSPFVGAIVQSIFASRSHRVHKRIWVACVMGVLISASLAGGLGVAVYASHARPNLPALLIWVQFANWSTALCDTVISAIFAYQMHKAGASATKGFNIRTDSVLSSLLKASLGTAAATTVIAIMNALSFLLNHETSSFYILTNMLMPGVYTICIMHVLNSRKRLKLMASEGSMEPTRTVGMLNTGGRRKSQTTTSRGLVSEIGVTLETVTEVSAAEPDDIREKRGGSRGSWAV